MTEQAWRHRFVQALHELLRAKTGLGVNTCFELAFSMVDEFWRDMQLFRDPEEAARSAYENLREVAPA